MKMLSYVNLYNEGTTFLKVLIIYRDKKNRYTLSLLLKIHIIFVFQLRYFIITVMESE